MPTHSTTVCTGLREKKVPVMADLPEMASVKLKMPNTAPRISPSTGPQSMAPMAMGRVKKLMYSGPTGTAPRPNARIASSMATRRASFVSLPTFVLVVFIFNSSCCRSVLRRIQRIIFAPASLCLSSAAFPSGIQRGLFQSFAANSPYYTRGFAKSNPYLPEFRRYKKAKPFKIMSGS